MQFYNPYYQDIAGVSTTQASTTNSDSLDLSHVGDQTQERDNRLTFSILLGDHPENVSIELEDVQKLEDESCITKVNFSGKPKNQELEFTMENIPPGLYRVIIENKSINGLSEDWKLLKYDNGVTTETEFTGELGAQSKRILMNIGEFELQGEFIDSLGNQSDLDKTQVRRRRIGGFLTTTGSFQLSSGYGGGGHGWGRGQGAGGSSGGGRDTSSWGVSLSTGVVEEVDDKPDITSKSTTQENFILSIFILNQY